MLENAYKFLFIGCNGTVLVIQPSVKNICTTASSNLLESWKPKLSVSLCKYGVKDSGRCTQRVCFFILLTENERLVSPFAQHQITEIMYSISDQTFQPHFSGKCDRKAGIPIQDWHFNVQWQGNQCLSNLQLEEEGTLWQNLSNIFGSRSSMTMILAPYLFIVHFIF